MTIFYRFLLVVSLLTGTDHFIYSHNLTNTTKLFIKSLDQKKDPAILAIRYAFAKLQYLEKNRSSLSSILKSSEIQKLFSKFENQIVDVSLEQAQWLMQAHLHTILYKKIMIQSEQQLVEIYQAKNYWRQELFRERLPLYKKSIFYWFHTKSYKQSAKKHVKQLVLIEEYINNLLGIACHGYKNITNASSTENIKNNVIQQAAPLYDVCKKKHTNNALIFFNDISEINRTISSNKKIVTKKLSFHGIPCHLQRHWFAYSATFAAIIAGYLSYKKYEQEIPTREELDEKRQAWWKHYISKPIDNFITTFWSNNKTKDKNKFHKSADALGLSDKIVCRCACISH